MVRKIVEDRKVSMEKQSSGERGVAMDAVDLLLREHVDGNEKQSPPLDFISGNIIEMMIPGEETVPTAMTLAVKFLSDSPVTLKRLVVRRTGLHVGVITWNHCQAVLLVGLIIFIFIFRKKTWN